MRYSVHTTKIHHVMMKKSLSVMKFMQKYPRYHTMNKKVKFLGKGAKVHAQAQKISKVDFTWRIW